MRVLQAPTEDFVKRERGTLSATAATGSNVVIAVESAEGVAANDYVVIGHEGNELAELCLVSAVTNTSITVTTLKFNHTAEEPFTVYRYNKRKFYGATTSTGSYTELTADGSPKDISVDNSEGTILEYSGSTYTYFKSTYYNSTTAEETDIADSVAISGDESSRYASLYAIRKHAGLAGNPRYSDLRIETKRGQAENEINSVLAAKYTLPLAEVPALVSNICELLAAGYIDYEEFGKDSEGVKWLGEGRALLTAIRKGTQLLIGTDGTELTRNAKVDVLDGYPDDADTDSAQFSMSQVF
ncbi:MAG: phage protein Gp36 family protein [Planctomycetota bacterium]